MKILPLKPEHFDLLDMRDYEKQYVEHSVHGQHALHVMAKMGVGGCFVYDGRIIAIMGYTQTDPGIFQMWAFPSIWIKKYPLQYLRAARKMVGLCEEMENPKRLETVSIDYPGENKWMKFLGFTAPEQVPLYVKAVAEEYANDLPLKFWHKEYH